MLWQILIVLFIVLSGIFIAGIMVAKKLGYNFACLEYFFHKTPTYPIDEKILGINNFFNIPECGDIKSQYEKILKTKIPVVRILFAWTDGVQHAPNAPIDFSFYDDIVNNCPPGVRLLAVIAHTPSWFLKTQEHSSCPIDAWIDSWLTPVVKRYKGRKEILGYEIWNEPDASVVVSDAVLCLESPENYVTLLKKSSAIITREDRDKLVVMAATFSIQQHYPRSLDYNKKLKNLGVDTFIDIWNIHLYGDNYVDLFKTKGVMSFLKSIAMPIWITEVGCRDQSEQKEYFEGVYSFLMKYVKPEKIFYYILTDIGLENNTYGLITADGKISGLYRFLVERFLK